MSMGKEAKEWHALYESTHSTIREAVDAAYLLVRNEFAERGFVVSNDDRAETFVAALMQYLIDSAE